MVVVIAMWHCASRFSFALDVLVTHLMHADHRVYYVWIRAAEASVPPAVRELRWGAKKVSSRRQIDSSSARCAPTRPDSRAANGRKRADPADLQPRLARPVLPPA
jgi:hypothetical protein